MKISSAKHFSISALFLFVFLIVDAVSVFGDEFHYINQNIGNRASGMAGAYTAVSDDTSGCFYNPAGIAFAPGTKLSASVNAVQISTKKYNGAITGADGGKHDYNQRSFNLLPNFFGLIQKMGPGMFGISYSVPDIVQRRQKQTFSNIDTNGNGSVDINAYHVNQDNFDKSYFLGTSYALKINESLAIGGTLYYHYRDKQDINNIFAEYNGGENVIVNSYRTLRISGWQPNLGIMWEPNKKIALGLSISQLFITSTDDESQVIANSFSNPDTLNYNNQTKTKNDDQPLSIKAGIAWFYSPSLLLSFDLKYHDSYDINTVSNDKVNFIDVLNAAFGVEYYLTDFLALRGGFHTDLSNTEKLTSVEKTYDNEQIDIYGLSSSLTFFSSKTSITFGLNYSYGSGDSHILGGGRITKVDINSLAIQLATSFTY